MVTETKTCNECGQPALYWNKGWDDEEWGVGEYDTFWCEKHKHFKPGAEPINQGSSLLEQMADTIDADGPLEVTFLASAHPYPSVDMEGMPPQIGEEPLPFTTQQEAKATQPD